MTPPIRSSQNPQNTMLPLFSSACASHNLGNLILGIGTIFAVPGIVTFTVDRIKHENSLASIVSLYMMGLGFVFIFVGTLVNAGKCCDACESEENVV